MNKNEADQLMDAVNRWESAECFDCGAHFTNQDEALEHEHGEVWHLYTGRTVN